MRNITLNCLIVVVALAIAGAFSRSAEAQPPIPTTNLLTWVAADNINGDDTVPLNGAPVSVWTDLSGNGHNFDQMNHENFQAPSTFPTYSTSGGPGGWPTVEFDGVRDMLSHSFWTSNDPFDPEPWSSPQFFIVMKAIPRTDGNQSRILGTNGSTMFNWNLDDTTGGIRGRARENIGNPFSFRYLNRFGFDDMTPTPSVADYKILTLYTDVDPSGSPQVLTANSIDDVGNDGVLDRVTTLGTPDGAYGTEVTGFPANTAIPYTPGGANDTFDLGLGGDTDGDGAVAWTEMSVSELIVYDSPTGYPMSDADRIQVEEYLFQKYFVDSPPAIQNSDFDGNLAVDGADFLAWQRGFGTGATLVDGDANGDNVVDGADLAIWEAQYGTVSTLSAASSAVPEPSALLLSLLACGCLTLTNRRRKLS